MKVLHFVRTYPSLSETFVQRFVEKTLNAGEAMVAALQVTPENPKSGKEQISDLGHYFSRRSIKGISKFLRQCLTGIPNWQRNLHLVIKDNKPDVVHCHFGPAGLKFLKFQQQMNLDIPFVTTFYGFDASSLPKSDPLYRQGLQTLWKKGKFFLAEGPCMAGKLIELGAPDAKVKINPLLIPITEYKLKKHFRSITAPIRFLLIGRFTEKKGFHLFFEALGKIQDKVPGFTVTVIGFGEMEGIYKNIIHNYGYSEKVNFCGGQPHNEVIKQLQCHDFFVHPSLTAKNGDSEGGAPTIIIEAQAVGIPVLASSHADIPYVMGYDKFLSQEGDIESLQSKILEAVIYQGWKSLVAEGKDKVKSQHDLHQSDYYIKILNSI